MTFDIGFLRKPARRAAILAAATATLAALAGCATSSSSATTTAHGGTGAGAGAAAFPAKVVTAGGTTRIAERPVAIVSLSATATDMLYAIGAGPQVKAVDQYSDYPKGAPISNLSAYTPNIEAIVATKPDLVVVPQDTNGMVGKLAKFSIPVLVLPAPRTIDGALAQYDQLGLATGHLAQAQRETATVRARITAIKASAPAHPKAISYYYEVGVAPYYSVTSDTFIGNMLDLLGMKSIADSAKGAAASGGFPPLSAEFIVNANPGYIILADSQQGRQSPATVAARPGWSKLTAVTSGHVIVIADDIASQWGTRLPDLLQIVVTAMKQSG